MTIRILALLAASCTALLAQAPASLHVLSSNGIRAVVEQVLPQAEQAVGMPIVMDYGTSANLRERIDAGETFDVLLATAPTLDALAPAGKVDPATRADLARSGIGIGIRAGASRPATGTPEELKQTFLNARSITFARTGASRPFIEAMMERLEIADQARAKTVLENGSTGATKAVAEGRVEIVLTLASEIIGVDGVDYVGQLPPSLQNYVVISGGVGAQASHRAAGEALIRFLHGPATEAALAANGMERQ